MCMSSRPSVMSNTRIYAGEAVKNGKTVHVLAYQNAAITDGPNAMVLPFPTNKIMDEDNVIDTREFKLFLKNIVDATREQYAYHRTHGMTLGAASAKSIAKVFDVGSYTVVLANHVDSIPAALVRVPANKRPTVSVKFLNGIGDLYPDQPVAVCCWNGEIEAEPLMWWYEPKDTSKLFIPTMDAHDGQAPIVGARVKTDHIICVGSMDADRGEEVHYSQLDKMPSDVRKLLPKRVHGHKLPKVMDNADCFVKTAALHPNKSLWMDTPGQRVELERGPDYVSEMHGWS